MSEEALRARINDLENELKQKNTEINSYLDRIEGLESNVMKLEGLIQEAEAEGTFDPQKVQDTKLSIELKEKEREMRELKNKMGFLRKEKIELQKKLEQQQYQPKKESTVIRIKEKTETGPFDGLVKELQTKINKQQALIKQLKDGGTVAEKPESQLEKELQLKNKTIEELESKIVRLEEKLESINSQNAPEGGSDQISLSLTEELQDKLNRTKRRVLHLQERLSKYEEVKDTLGLTAAEEQMYTSQEEFQQLRRELSAKTQKIQELKETISCLEDGQSEKKSPEILTGPEMISELTEELQKKLNKAKIRIQQLENELESKPGAKTVSSTQLDQMQEVISEKDQTIENLKTTLESKDKMVKNKQEELETIKNEAMKCNSEIEKLKHTLDSKEDQIESLKSQLATVQQDSEQKTSQSENAISLRVKELKNLVKELKKENAQQLVEISELRK
jgi:chromosome segregation ATPase